MRYLVLVSAVLFLISCGSSGAGGGGGPVTSLDGYTTESVGGGITKATKKDANGDLSEIGYLLNGVKNGVWSTYYDGEKTGSIKTATSYINGTLNGPYFEYSNRGQIDAEVNYANGEYHGKVSTYKYGRPVSSKQYSSNKLNGLSVDYFDNGKIQKETNFKDGKQHGVMTWFNEDGEKIMEYEYKNGEKVSGGIIKGE